MGQTQRSLFPDTSKGRCNKKIEQGQTRHGGPVFKKAPTARARCVLTYFPELGGARSHTHVALARFARCAHVTQVVHFARKANTMKDEAPVNKLTSSNKLTSCTWLARRSYRIK